MRAEAVQTAPARVRNQTADPPPGTQASPTRAAFDLGPAGYRQKATDGTWVTGPGVSSEVVKVRVSAALRPGRVLVVVGSAAAIAGCSDGGASAHRQAQPASHVLVVGRPITPRPARIQRGGTLELQATGVGSPRSPGFRLAVLRTPGADPRDLCVATVPVGLGVGEANTSCDVRSPGAAAVFVQQPGIPDRLGPQPTVVAGIAPPDVVRVELNGPGGHRVPPLSRHRAFLALYAHGVRGHVQLIADRATGAPAVRTFSLPLSPHANLFPGHPHRRRGAVFDDEVGENIIGRSYSSVVHRFGPPAAINRKNGAKCVYYEVVGDGPVGWRSASAPAND